MPILLLSAASFISWFISMIAGGGSPLLLLPTVTLLLGPMAVAPVLTLGLLTGNLQRSLLLRQYIHWEIVSWQLPGVMVGSVLGAVAFTRIHAEGLQLVIGAILLGMVLYQGVKPYWRAPSWTMKVWYFLPLGFLSGLVSGLVGTTGPMMNPVYLGYGLTKEAMVATKTLNLVCSHCLKLLIYSLCGVLNPELLGYGLLIGVVAIPANWLGQQVLQAMSAQQFKQTVFLLIGVSGLVMCWQQRSFLGI
jgi:uncharacterized membrane protein YfcA